MKNIIFLDIDGVLNYQEFFKNPIRKLFRKLHLKSYTYPNGQICRRNLFWVGLLCRLKKVDVVLSTSWRYFWDENGNPNTDEVGQNHACVDKLLRRWGINIVGKTGNIITDRQLHEFDKDELQAYLKRSKAIQFVDDKGQKLEHDDEYIISYTRGTQIFDWIDKHNFNGNYAILEDDYHSIIIYKELAKHTVISSYYGKHGGFGFKQFISAWKKLGNI